MNKEQHQIWEERYKSEKSIAKYPFDQIISMVMNTFKQVEDKSTVNVLDYGCGGGNNFWFLAREGFTAYAVDVSESALKMTKRRLEEEDIYLPSDRYRLISEEYLPFPDNFFSAVIDRESLCQSSWTEIQSRVREFKRILKPGGYYLGINFTCAHPDIKSADFLGFGDWNNFQTGLFKDQGQRHLFSVNDISELFSDWNIESLSELKITKILGNAINSETSEFILMAHT